MGDRVSSPNLKMVKGNNSPNEKLACAKCGRFILVSAWWEQGIALVLERVVTR